MTVNQPIIDYDKILSGSEGDKEFLMTIFEKF